MKNLEESKETKVVTKLVRKLIDNSAIDEVVLAVVESALDSVFDDLATLSKRKYLEAHHWQDYLECLQNGKAFIRTLQYFSTNWYEKEQKLLDEYGLKLQEYY